MASFTDINLSRDLSCSIDKLIIMTKADVEKIDANAPKDKFWLVYISFFLLGQVHILPWSFFVTANDYWMYKFRNTSLEEYNSEDRTELQTEFFSALNITLQVSDVTFLFLTLIFGHRFSVNLKIIGSVLVIFLMFVLLTVFIDINTDSWQMGFFVMTMLFVALINGMNSVFGMTMYTILSNFPDDYLAPYLNGQGLAGIFSAALQIMSLSIGMSTQISALVYFGLGVFVNGLTLALLLYTVKNAFYQFHLKKSQQVQREKMISYAEFTTTFRKMWPSVAVMLLWILTVSPVHSSVTSLVVSENEGASDWNDVYFVPVSTFLIPAFADLVGRAAAPKLNINLSGIWWTVFSAARMFVFVPLLMLCNAQPRHHGLPVVFQQDYQYIIIMIIFALTNGYLLSLCSVIVPKLVPKEELETGYHIYMVATGIMLGSLSWLGLVFVKLL